MTATFFLNWSLQPAKNADKAAPILATGPADRYESCSLFFVLAINAAVKRIWIISPYSCPTLSK